MKLTPFSWGLAAMLLIRPATAQDLPRETPPSSPQKAEPAAARAVEPQEVPSIAPLRWAPHFVFATFWDLSVPLGQQRFVDRVSAGGFSFEGRVRLAGPWGVGMLLGWHLFRQKTNDIAELNGAVLWGTHARELATTQVIGQVHFLPWGPGRWGPHLALGVGVSYEIRSILASTVEVSTERWALTFVPELGFELPLGPIIALFDVRLTAAPGSNDEPSNFALNLCWGLGFP